MTDTGDLEEICFSEVEEGEPNCTGLEHKEEMRTQRASVDPSSY